MKTKSAGYMKKAPTKKKIFELVAAALLAMAIIEGLLQLTSYGLLQYRVFTYEDSLKNSNVILCVGDSMTAVGLNESYPALLQKKLDRSFGDGKYVVINGGMSGASADEILSAAKERLKKLKPKIVVSMIGINDILQPGGESYRDKNSRFVSINVIMWLKNKIKKKYFPNIQDQLEHLHKLLLDPIQDYEKKADSLFEIRADLQALQEYKRLAVEHPEDKSIQQRLAVLILLDSDLSAAKKTIESAVQKINDPQAIPSIATQIIHRLWNPTDDKFELTKELLHKNLEKYPNDIITMWLLARTHRMVGREQEAGAYYENMFEASNCDEEVLIGYFKSSLYREHRERYNKSNRKCKFPELPSRPQTNTISTEERIKRIKNFELGEAVKKQLNGWGEIVAQSGAQHMVIQYPFVRSDTLKEIYGSESGEIKIIDVTSEFEKSILENGYLKVFKDKNSIIFGHATEAGNSIFADAIFKEIKN